MERKEWSEREGDHREIGRYFSEFSTTVADMRRAMERQLASDPPILAQLPFGDAGAAQVAEAFFAMCRAVMPPQGREVKVEVLLHQRTMKETRWRNDLAHGDWHVASLMPGAISTVVRIRPMDTDPHKTISLSVADLDKRADDVISLGEMLCEFWALCFHEWPYANDPTIRFGDIFAMRDKQVVRAGARLNDYPEKPIRRGHVTVEVSASHRRRSS